MYAKNIGDIQQVKFAYDKTMGCMYAKNIGNIQRTTSWLLASNAVYIYWKYR